MARFENDSRDRGSKRPRGQLELRPLEVAVEFDNVERAMKILKRKIADEGIFRELKKRRHYEKPSEAKKRKSREAERRRRKAVRNRRR
ncbi:MAG: small subunit ribosomal protein S21 [Myxococcota bacterium]|jgi:small subunit ribosomal protein S21